MKARLVEARSDRSVADRLRHVGEVQVDLPTHERPQGRR